jgi:hypothetical protein
MRAPTDCKLRIYFNMLLVDTSSDPTFGPKSRRRTTDVKLSNNFILDTIKLESDVLPRGLQSGRLAKRSISQEAAGRGGEAMRWIAWKP